MTVCRWYNYTRRLVNNCYIGKGYITMNAAVIIAAVVLVLGIAGIAYTVMVKIKAAKEDKEDDEE